jgi:hypothetical protein
MVHILCVVRLLFRRSYIIISFIVIVVVLVISSIIALIEYNQLTATRINFTLSANQIDVIQGSNNQIQVKVTLIGKAENITLSNNVGLSSINCTFEPSRGISNFSSTLTVNVHDSTPSGNYLIAITALINGQEKNVSLTVLVIPFLSPDVITISGRGE